MEIKTRFDIDAAVARWRQGLQNSPALCGQDLEELESHLRDSVQKLVARGLDSREAFLLAVHRLGAHQELEAEFAKVNVRQVWFDRGVWILCGLLTANMLYAVASVFSNSVLNLALWHGMNAYVVGPLTFFTKSVVCGGFAAGVFLVLTRFTQPLSRAAQACLKHPVWSGIALVLALEGLQLLPRHAMRFLEPLWQVIATPTGKIPQESELVIQSWFLWAGITSQLLWIASVPLFAGYVWKKTSGRRLPNAAKTTEDFETAEQEVIRSLQGQGFSVQEAILLIDFRRNAAEGFAGASETKARSPWLERGLWMLVGVVVGRLFIPLVLEPSTILLAASHTSSSLMQHLAGIGSMCLCLGAIAGILMAVSAGVTRYPSQVERIGRFCSERPALAAVLLTALCLGTGVSLGFLERAILAGGRFGIGAIGSSWLGYCTIVTQLIVPVALLLWLAKNRGNDARGVSNARV